MTTGSAVPPSTPDYVRFHALHRPKAIAVIENGREIDYATFHGDLGKIVEAMREFRLARGSFVAVPWESLYGHWLLLLACERLGLATASYLPGERGTLAQLGAHVQLVLGGDDADFGKARRHPLTRDWLAGVLAGPARGEATDTPMTLDEPQRLRRSSGTTGGFKMMVSSRRVQEYGAWSGVYAHGMASESRLLVSTPFTVGSAFSRATTCLRLGGTCIWDPVTPAARAILKYRPTHMRLFQFQMKGLLAGLPVDFPKPADLTVMVGAAPLSGALRRELLARLATRISYTYSSNETGGIAVVGEDGVYTLRPGVQAEIVDESGARVPDGQLGEMKVRTPGTIDGYLGNPALTAQKFQEGWFLTGDAGVMTGPGRFRLMGRLDDVLNVGGRKISPVALETVVERHDAVDEAGVTSIAGPEGVEEICIAVVLGERLPRKETLASIGASLPKDIGRMRLKACESLPRTVATGKLRRNELKKLFLGQ